VRKQRRVASVLKYQGEVCRPHTAMASSNVEELGLELWNLCKVTWGKQSADGTAVQSLISHQSLIDKGADVNRKNKHGDTLLIKAASYGNLDAVNMLLAVEGIDIGAKSKRGGTPFLFACGRDGNIECVKALLAALNLTSNFDINAANLDGMTALMNACMNGDFEIIKLLLSIPRINMRLKGGDVFQRMTALDWTQGIRKEDEIRALFQGEILALHL
jgi:ankyrin repeat protein